MTGTHGGARNFALPQDVRQLAELLLWRLSELAPRMTIRERVAELASVGIVVERNFVQRALKRTGLSFKKVNRKKVRPDARLSPAPSPCTDSDAMCATLYRSSNTPTPT